MAVDPKLPEQFAPTGPRLSRFPIQPAPPIRPRLFPDEARFTLRLSLLAGGSELAAWAWLAASGGRAAVLGLAAFHLLRPAWARAGMLLSRRVLAAGLLSTALAAIAASALSHGALLPLGFIAAGLPAVGDLCSTALADSLTVERRPAAHAWLDMAQGLCAVAGLSIGQVHAGAGMVVGTLALLLAFGGVGALRDRGTPRSCWPMAAYAATLRTPLAGRLVLAAFLGGILAGPGGSLWPLRLRLGLSDVDPRLAGLLSLAGMAFAARLEPRLPNVMWLPRIGVGLAILGSAAGGKALAGFAIGVMAAAIPAAVARGAGEMERPLASSLAWSALFAGAALGAMLGS